MIFPHVPNFCRNRFTCVSTVRVVTSEFKFHIGDAVSLDILIPGEKTLRLAGEIRWIDRPNSTVGAQFKAFGAGRKYNPLTALEKLRLLQKKFS